MRALFNLLIPVVLAAWPPGSVRRAFYTTPKGAIHYIVRGNVSHAPPLVFLHGHPRSTEQLKTLAAELPSSQPLIAVDYFGAGASDECQCNESIDEFVPYTTFAQWTLEICDREGVGPLIPFGALTGTGPAWELAWLAAKQGRAAALLQFESYYLSPRAKKFVDDVYIPSIRHLPLHVNGSHLLYWWLKGDAGPIGPTSAYPVSADLATNEQKTVDSLISQRTGWEYKMAWTAYNDLIPGRLRDLVSAGVHQLYIDAGHADYIGNKYGLDKNWSVAQIAAIVPPKLLRHYEIADGTEGALEQNATLAAKVINDFLRGL